MYDIVIWNRTDICCYNRAASMTVSLLDVHGRVIATKTGPSSWKYRPVPWVFSFNGSLGASIKILFNESDINFSEVSLSLQIKVYYRSTRFHNEKLALILTRTFIYLRFKYMVANTVERLAKNKLITVVIFLSQLQVKHARGGIHSFLISIHTRVHYTLIWT